MNEHSKWKIEKEHFGIKEFKKEHVTIGNKMSL